MKPGSISKKVEKMLEMHKPDMNKDQTLEEGEEEGKGNGEINLDEDLIMRFSGGAKDLASVTQLKIIGYLGIKGLQSLESVINLKYLNLSFSGLSKIEGLKKCAMLTNVILCNNNISYIKGLEECKLIVQLDLSSNSISEIEGLDKLIKLQKLNLSGNNICLIKNIDSLKSLACLLLAQNKIKKIDFFPLLPQVINNNLIYTFINEQIDRFYQNFDYFFMAFLMQVEELNLNQNQIDSIHPKLFENLKSLISLDISNNKLRSVEFLNGMIQLEKFSAANNCIEKVFMRVELEELEHLDLGGNQLNDVRRFGEFFPNLFTLDISKNNIFTDDELDFVYDMDTLCEINFSENLISTNEFIQTFLRRHPELDVVNNKVIHDAGYRFELEIQEVKGEIIQFEKQEKIRLAKEAAEALVNQTAESQNDENNQINNNKQKSNPQQEIQLKDFQIKQVENEETEAILKSHNIKDLDSLMKDIQKEKQQEKESMKQFLSYYKHLNDDISIKDTKIKNSIKEEEENNSNEEEDEDEEQQGIPQHVNRFKGLQQNQIDIQKKKQNKNMLKKFDEYAALEDEDTLKGFVTELEGDLSQIRAQYHAIKGIKHLQKHRAKSLTLEKDELYKSQTSFREEDEDNNDLRSSTSSMNKLIFKKKIIPLSQIRNSISSLEAQSVRSSTSSQKSGIRNTPLSKTQNVPLPIRNVALQKELKELKRNINDQEYLKKIGFGQNSESNLHVPSSAKTAASKQNSSQQSREKLSPRSVQGIKKGSRNFSLTMKEPLEKKQYESEQKVQGDDESDKLSRTSNLSGSKGIIYSNRNSKTKNKLMDAISSSQNNNRRLKSEIKREKCFSQILQLKEETKLCLTQINTKMNSDRGKLLAIMAVQLGDNPSLDIKIFENDEPQWIAEDFIKKNGFDKDILNILVQNIQINKQIALQDQKNVVAVNDEDEVNSKHSDVHQENQSNNNRNTQNDQENQNSIKEQNEQNQSQEKDKQGQKNHEKQLINVYSHDSFGQTNLPAQVYQSNKAEENQTLNDKQYNQSQVIKENNMINSIQNSKLVDTENMNTFNPHKQNEENKDSPVNLLLSSSVQHLNNSFSKSKGNQQSVLQSIYPMQKIKTPRQDNKNVGYLEKILSKNIQGLSNKEEFNKPFYPKINKRTEQLVDKMKRPGQSPFERLYNNRSSSRYKNKENSPSTQHQSHLVIKKACPQKVIESKILSTKLSTNFYIMNSWRKNALVSLKAQKQNEAIVILWILLLNLKIYFSKKEDGL